MSPTNTVSIPPYPEGLVFLRIRPDAQDVPVEVFDLHLQRPLEIVGRVSDFCAGRHILSVQCADISHADPYPYARLALVVIGQEDGALFSRDAGKSVAHPPSQFEAKSVQVVGDAGVHVLDAKDWQGEPKVFVEDSAIVPSGWVPTLRGFRRVGDCTK